MQKLRLNKAGFTEIEIILTIVVLGILGLISYVVVGRHGTTAKTNSSLTNQKTVQKSAPQGNTTSNALKTYTLKYDKLSFQYPSSWNVLGANTDNASDYVEFSSSDGFHFAVQDGRGTNMSEFIPKIITSTPIVFAGQASYLAFLSDVPTAEPTQTLIASGSVIATLSDPLSRPTDHNAIANDGFGGHNISISMLYGDGHAKAGLTAQTIQNDSNYEQAKLVIESMHY